MKDKIWEKCVAFHGHECGGLTIGYKAALYAIELLGLAREDGAKDCCVSGDEELVCIAENDACGVDAVQVILGCSIGKGNLLFHLRGKQAFNFYDRRSGKSVRLMLRPKPQGMTREQSFAHYQSLEPKEMFDAMPTAIPLPESARLFDSYVCSVCGESTGANWVRFADGKPICLDCCGDYSRFDV